MVTYILNMHGQEDYLINSIKKHKMNFFGGGKIMQRARTQKESDEKVPAEGVKLTLKNFKLSPDIQHFYRFIYENQLRREAHLMMSELADKLKSRAKKKRARKTKAKPKVH